MIVVVRKNACMLFFIQKHFHLKCQLTDKREFFIHGLPARYFLTSKQSSKVKPSLQEKQLIRFTTKIIFNLSNENWNFGKLVFKVEIFPILKSFLMKLLAILTKKFLIFYSEMGHHFEHLCHSENLHS